MTGVLVLQESLLPRNPCSFPRVPCSFSRHPCSPGIPVLSPGTPVPQESLFFLQESLFPRNPCSPGVPAPQESLPIPKASTLPRSTNSSVLLRTGWSFAAEQSPCLDFSPSSSSQQAACPPSPSLKHPLLYGILLNCQHGRPLKVRVARRDRWQQNTGRKGRGRGAPLFVKAFSFPF